MKHFASPKFWTAYEALPLAVRKLADANYALLKRDPRHGFKKDRAGNRFGLAQYWYYSDLETPSSLDSRHSQ